MQRQPWDSGHTTLKRHYPVKFHYGPSVREPLRAVFWDHELFFNWGRLSWSMAAMSLSQHISLHKAMRGWREKLWYSNSVRRDWLGKQRGTNPISTLKWPFLKYAVVFPRCFKQRAHTSGLLNLCSFLWHSSKGGGVASLLLPESPTGSQLRGALSGRCSDRFQMLLEDGRERARSVEVTLLLWLIGVRMKLGVTFPLSRFLLPCLLMPVLYEPRLDGVELGWGAGSIMLQVWLFATPLSV